VASLLPLFPLELVLFPGTPLPLHIFEPRYQEMIGECLANHALFGVVRVQEQALAEIGCTAEIVNVTKKYPDGRMDIVAEGRKRFELIEVNRERAFLRAEIMMLEDEPGTANQKQREGAIELHAQILAMAGAVPDLSSVDQDKLSFQIAGSLPLDLDFKQKLLGMSSESKRLAALIEYLEGAIPNLQRAVRVREKAGGNGHVH
jgi:Lon protease-like protein